jgi:hypothetical protein
MEDTKLVQCPHCERIKVADGCLNNCEQCSIRRWNDPSWTLLGSLMINSRKTLGLS